MLLSVKYSHIQEREAGHILAGLSKKRPKISLGLPNPSLPFGLCRGEIWRRMKELGQSQHFFANSCLCSSELFPGAIGEGRRLIPTCETQDHEGVGAIMRLSETDFCIRVDMFLLDFGRWESGAQFAQKSENREEKWHSLDVLGGSECCRGRQLLFTSVSARRVNPWWRGPVSCSWVRFILKWLCLRRLTEMVMGVCKMLVFWTWCFDTFSFLFFLRWLCIEKLFSPFVTM